MIGRRRRFGSSASHATICAPDMPATSARAVGFTSSRTPPARFPIARISWEVRRCLKKLRSLTRAPLCARNSRAALHPVQPGRT